VPASALASSGDISSTHAYILANYALVRTGHAKIKTAEKNIAALNRTIGQECGKVGADAPQNQATQQVSEEVAGAIEATVYHSDVSGVEAFVNAVKPLRWSNHKLTHIADAYANSLQQLVDLPMPSVCADVRAFVSSSYLVVPTSTVEFDKLLNAIGASTIPQRLLAPYEQPSDRAVAARSDKLETQLDNDETSIGFNDWNLLLETIGLPQ
jgi:hypothetical protein